MPGQTGYEFSRPVRVDELESGGEIRRNIEADKMERRELAERLGLVDLKCLAAEIALRREAGGPLFSVGGRIMADVVQSCVVTRTPVENHIEEAVVEMFAPEGYEPPEGIESGDLPEYFDGHDIDIGELAAQLLSLSIDPYPRAAGAIPEWPTSGEPTETEVRRPFEGLADMLKKQN
jgi:uncharacterized metal-binding protein YceD (DUF177 family)